MTASLEIFFRKKIHQDLGEEKSVTLLIGPHERLLYQLAAKLAAKTGKLKKCGSRTPIMLSPSILSFNLHKNRQS